MWMDPLKYALNLLIVMCWYGAKALKNPKFPSVELNRPNVELGLLVSMRWCGLGRTPVICCVVLVLVIMWCVVVAVVFVILQPDIVLLLVVSMWWSGRACVCSVFSVMWSSPNSCDVLHCVGTCVEAILWAHVEVFVISRELSCFGACIDVMKWSWLSLPG